MSKSINVKYSKTTDYHEKVMVAMDSLEKQVYKPADITKNFMPPPLPSGERIITALKD